MTELVHVEGENGAGWMVPREKPWAELTEHEQVDRVYADHGISCPGWCSEHFWGCGAGVVTHIWDFVDSGPWTAGLEQVDVLSIPDGDLIEREPAEIRLGLDEEPEMQAAIEPFAGAADEYGRWALDDAEAVKLAENLRGLKQEWASPMAEALRTLAAAIPQPRRSNGITFLHGRGAD